MLLFCIALTFAAVDVLLGGPGLQSIPFDHTLSIIELVVCSAYLYVAIGKVYGVTGAARVLDVVALTIASGAIVLGYRFVLLPITLCTA